MSFHMKCQQHLKYDVCKPNARPEGNIGALLALALASTVLGKLIGEEVPERLCEGVG